MAIQLKHNITEIYHTAFYNVLKERLELQPPDFDMLINLFAEIIHRLCNIIPNRKDIHKEIQESLDIDIFIQSIKNNAFSQNDMCKLINYCFGKILEYEAPARNSDTKQIRDKLLEETVNHNFKFSDVVPKFVLQFHQKMDEIENDIALVYKMVDKFKKTT